MTPRKTKTHGVDASRVVAAQKQAARSSGMGDILFWKPEDGDNPIRILPPFSEAGIFWHEVWYHYNVCVDDQGNRRLVTCPRHHMDVPEDSRVCPICDFVEALAGSEDPTDKEKVSEIRAKPRFNFQIIDRQAEDLGIQFYGAPVTVAEKVFGYFNDPDYGDITNPEEGYDLKIVKKKRKGAHPKSKKFTDIEYDVKAVPRRSPVMVDVDGNPSYDWEGDLIQLDQLPRYYCSEDLETMLETGIFIPWEERVDQEDSPKTETKKSQGVGKMSVTFEAVNQMNMRQLRSLVLGGKIELDPDDYETVPELREGVCTVLGLEEGGVSGEGEGDAFTAEDIKAMRMKDLRSLITENEIELDPDDFESAGELQTALIEMYELEEVAKAEPETVEDEGGGEEDTFTAEDIRAMRMKDLRALITENETALDPDDFESAGELQTALIEMYELEEVILDADDKSKSDEKALDRLKRRATKYSKGTTKKPVAKKPVAKKPVAKKPIAKKSIAKKPLTKKIPRKKK